MVYKPSIGEKIFNVFNIIFMALMIIITLYPFWYCVTCSLSKDIVGNTATLMLLPKGLSFDAYTAVLDRPSIISGYKVTIIVVVVATTLNVFFTSIAAFLLTRKRFAIKGFLTWMMLFTMYFGGGMIPTYIIYANVLNLRDTYAVLIIPGLITVYNMIVMRTNFAAIPSSLEESVMVDGGNDMHVLFHIILPYWVVGSFTVTTVPPPGALVISSVPPCICTISSHTARPIPVPLTLVFPL